MNRKKEKKKIKLSENWEDYPERKKRGKTQMKVMVCRREGKGGELSPSGVKSKFRGRQEGQGIPINRKSKKEVARYRKQIHRLS